MNKTTVTIYTCEYCGKEFHREEDCRDHEETHIEYFDNADLSDIADRLNSLADYAYSYRISNQVLGMPIETFKNLMHKAANLVLANT